MPRSPEHSAVILLRTSDALKKKMKAIADEQRRSLTAQTIIWIEQAIAQYEKETAKQCNK